LSQQEQAAIKQVIDQNYIEGIQRQQNKALAQQGFHPDFEMLVAQDDALQKVTLEAWFERIEAAKAQDPNAMKFEIDYDVFFVDVKANVAAAKLEVRRDGNFFATDFLSLYKFSDGWKIVSKTFTFSE